MWNIVQNVLVQIRDLCYFWEKYGIMTKKHGKLPEKIAIRALLCMKLAFLKFNLNVQKNDIIINLLYVLTKFIFPAAKDPHNDTPWHSEEILYHGINVWICFFVNVFDNKKFHELLMDETIIGCVGFLMESCVSM